jgi:5-methylcytosine-specific restriction enzyme subunit McrC
MYADALANATSRGVVWDYRDRSDALVRPRGRIDSRTLTLRRFGVFPPVDCNFNDYTADTDPNRRLVAAASLLTRGSLALTPAGVKLRRMMEQFQDVSRDLDATNSRPAQVLGRRWEPFQTVLSLADVVLSHASLELRHGQVGSIGFVVNMNVCFERFVVVALRRALRLDEQRWRHHPPGLTLDHGGRLQIVPDAVWYGPNGKARMVIDAKYKRTVLGGVEDVVQMMSYCLALGTRHGVLVYGDADQGRHRMRHADIEVHVEPLSPDGTREELEERVQDLARRLEVLTQGAG